MLQTAPRPAAPDDAPPPAPSSSPTLAELGPQTLTTLVQDPAIAETVRFTVDVAEYQMRDEEVAGWTARLGPWGIDPQRVENERKTAAVAAVCLWFSRMSLAEFHEFHAETYERWARPYWELKDALKAQTERKN